MDLQKNVTFTENLRVTPIIFLSLFISVYIKYSLYFYSTVVGPFFLTQTELESVIDEIHFGNVCKDLSEVCLSGLWYFSDCFPGLSLVPVFWFFFKIIVKRK